MKIISTITICFVLILQSFAQTTIYGTIKDKGDELITGANIYIKNTFEGTSSDTDGRFSLSTNLTGEQVLVVSFLGYQTYEHSLVIDNKEISLNIILKPEYNEIGGVVITAGAFEASDEKKAVVLRPLDIVTTAGSDGDITGALNKLPGTMKVGEEGKLFVRGGDSYETGTFIDGLPVKNAYSSSMPDVPSRSRFSPFLFSGTVFSTGGYSAEYGQALSSALVLNSNDLPDNTVSSISLMSIGAGGSHTQRWENTSLTASAEYYNLGPYFYLIPQDCEWHDAPNGANGMMIFRHKTGQNGLLKGFANYSYSSSAMAYPDPSDINNNINIRLKNNNLYTQANYRDIINKKWISKSGISYTLNNDDIDLDRSNVDEGEKIIQASQTMTYIATNSVKIRGGVALSWRNYHQDYIEPLEENIYSSKFNDRLYAGFIETELNIGGRFAARAGGRYEYSDLLNRSNIAPRVSLAYKTGKYSQVSMAYGTFFQTPQDDYLRFTNAIDFEKASHYILNWQIMKDRRIFRIEAYCKKYDDLVKFETLHNPAPETYNNNGTGYAKGLDIFFRDQKTFSNGDYWISYSYIDTKRDYKNYPTTAIPTYVSNHNLSFVFKYWIEKISSQIGGSYSFASGRTYFNPNDNDFLSDRTKPYHDLSLNISYLTDIFKKFTIIHLLVSNVLGLDQVYQYRFQEVPGADGIYPSYEVKPPAKRFLFLGVFISI